MEKQPAGEERQPLSLKERQRREREQLILQTAEEVFTEKGYYDTSMEEIAVRVGVAKGTVYLHFPGKEDLVIAILTRMIDQLMILLTETRAGEGTPRKKLEDILRVLYGEFYSKRIQFFFTMYNSLTVHTFVEQHRAKMRERWTLILDQVNYLVDEAKKEGQIRRDIPTNIMVSVFFNLQTPRSYERLGVGTLIKSDEFAQYLIDLYFDGVAAH